jgi:serine protease inhibitor
MKKSYKILSVIILLSLSYACEVKDSIPDHTEIKITKSTEELIKSDNEFGIELFKELLEVQDVDSNIVFSPFSVSMALAMTYNGADGTTREAMESTLKKENLTVEEINEIYNNLMNGLKSVDPKVVLEIANSIWYRDNFVVEQDFINTNKQYYDAEVRALNFADPATINIINSWVAGKTHDKIDKIIEQISPLTVMFLINAIYFNGIWTYEFDEEDTENNDFYLRDGSIIQVPTMSIDGDFNYQANDIFSSVELFYGKGDYSMLILLPNEGKSIDDIINNLTCENWESWLENYTELEIVIYLPKFKFEFEDSLNTPLKNMGMEIAFLPDEANFSKINPDFDMYISMVKQKAFIDVNEKGTEAAAVTVVEIELTAMPDKEYFIANKPFLFAITEKKTKAILFIGIVNRPVYK